MKTFVPDSPRLLETLRAATDRIAPVWPLDRFVAVNPYLGLQDLDIHDAAVRLERVAGARSTLSGDGYRDRLLRGDFDHDDIRTALEETGSALTLPRVLRMLDEGIAAPDRPEVSTVADVLEGASGVPWARFSTEHLGSFLASYFDEGHAAWKPDARVPLYRAWKMEAEIDRTPEIRGARNFRAVIRSLPDSHDDAAAGIIARLGLPANGLELYLHRLLVRVGGWSAHAARIGWDRRLREGRDDDVRIQLLAVLLAFEAGLHAGLAEHGAEARWRVACNRLGRIAVDPGQGGSLEVRLVLQRALEIGFRRRLLADLAVDVPRSLGVADNDGAGAASRPRAQAVFCIDVRSEVFRRHLEGVAPAIRTLGFAGFFGFPLDVVPLGHEEGRAQCPVLLAPSHRVYEGVEGSRAEAERHRTDRRLLERAWKNFKLGAVSCFSFVSPLGLLYLPKLLADSLGLTRPVPDPSTAGLGRHADRRTVDAAEDLRHGLPTGLSHTDRVALAGGALRGMSLTRDFARLVALVGHGSTSVNNPHASGLDCGACGGRSGEANARVAAEVLNDPAVRRDLRDRGIEIPEDTVFVGALHDTTTDRVTVFDRERIPRSHAADLERFESDLSKAGAACRAERALRLPGNVPDADGAWTRRSRDWAQVRPEWGLAGCAAFIAAPRERTAGADLGGRAFLHGYSWREDDDFSILELIMTAPMVVASWINLQYYGSAVDPDVFGAGNKTLHNVVGGTLGVLEGNGGDLRTGLPWQSVHDGERLQHEPIRLHVVIEAPIEAMNAVIEKHESVRRLLDGGWIQLFALEADGVVRHRYDGDLRWRRIGTSPARETRALSHAS